VAEPDDDQVAYCAILDSVPLKSSSSSSKTSGSRSILPSSVPMSNLRVSAVLSLMTEVPEVVVADQGTPIEARFHKVAVQRFIFSLFMDFIRCW
jgi:hypothetical protein